MHSPLASVLLVSGTLLACGGGGDPVSAPTDDGGSPDGFPAGDAGMDAVAIDAAPPTKNIKHLVVIVQENHTFDAYFGRYCTAAAGSNPSCNTGPGCCEAAPQTEPSGASPVTLDDTENAGYDPNHAQACELSEMNDGGMDRYVTGAACSDARNFAIAPNTLMATYHDFAKSYAIADRYFQPIVGSTSSNDMYFAVAQYVFMDNSDKPSTIGHGCTLPATNVQYTGVTTIADLLISAKQTFGFYAQGYARMLASPGCPLPPADCAEHIPTVPCDYDPSDVPFEYYAQFADNPMYMKDFDDLAKDIAADALPAVTFVKGLQYHNEHPGYGTTIGAGEIFVTGVVDAIRTSNYANDTLVLLTWDEGGGFFDHVTPPASSSIDGKPYGTRVPLIAIGAFAKKNFVSHVQMEHSSVVKFIEWNFLDGKTGQLGARDTAVNNIGSLLDPAATGVPVPEE